MITISLGLKNNRPSTQFLRWTAPTCATALFLLPTIAFAFATESTLGAPATPAIPVITAIDHHRSTIYHSPQTPGFTSWVGAWVMPDGSIMTSFTQATGPVEGRPLAPKQIQQKLDWPPPGHSKNYDMTGLEMSNIHLRSTNKGLLWEKISADTFSTCMNGAAGQAEIACADGTIIRGVLGQYLPYNPELPKTSFLQRSIDGGRTWGKPELFLDPNRFLVFIKKMRVLSDGRIILLGGVAKIPATSRTRAEWNGLFTPLLMVSDNQGRSWQGPIAVVPVSHQQGWGGEEFDAAELSNGDLLCVFRRTDPREVDKAENRPEVRWQGVLQKNGDSWIPNEPHAAPLPRSGMPELLVTREGPILHIATSGIHWTNDAGNTWNQLKQGDGRPVPSSAYYPKSIQTDDGTILIFGHVGSDDAYGSVDQAIVMDSFRL